NIESNQRLPEVLNPEHRYIRIRIKDQGVGIHRDQMTKIFDPYFTTKQKGSGLGLAISFAIIQKHDGYILVESTVGQGTVFTVYLPAVDNW
ncbi:MAG: hybrid sensor histidine kinase/response regulator, partial [Candidatus Marinimicrobia bacterium]|nr:hybrid sensor histidine kinase/response regulator [Candidatus Neomarinimicrobiota bacterium]